MKESEDFGVIIRIGLIPVEVEVRIEWIEVGREELVFRISDCKSTEHRSVGRDMNRSELTCLYIRIMTISCRRMKVAIVQGFHDDAGRGTRLDYRHE